MLNATDDSEGTLPPPLADLFLEEELNLPELINGNANDADGTNAATEVRIAQFARRCVRVSCSSPNLLLNEGGLGNCWFYSVWSKAKGHRRWLNSPPGSGLTGPCCANTDKFLTLMFNAAAPEVEQIIDDH